MYETAIPCEESITVSELVRRLFSTPKSWACVSFDTDKSIVVCSPRMNDFGLALIDAMKAYVRLERDIRPLEMPPSDGVYLSRAFKVPLPHEQCVAERLMPYRNHLTSYGL